VQIGPQNTIRNATFSPQGSPTRRNDRIGLYGQDPVDGRSNTMD